MKKKTATKKRPIDVHIGEIVRFKRRMMGLTQTELGLLLREPVSATQIKLYEKGENGADANRLFQLAKVLKISVSDFFTGFSEKRRMEIENNLLQLEIQG